MPQKSHQLNSVGNKRNSACIEEIFQNLFMILCVCRKVTLKCLKRSKCNLHNMKYDVQFLVCSD